MFWSKVYKGINRVLETQFPCGHHVEKYATLDHRNRVSKTRFIGQNRVFETRDASKKYNLGIETTNYIVG